MINQKGFIQMPIFLAIIIGVFVVGGTIFYMTSKNPNTLTPLSTGQAQNNENQSLSSSNSDNPISATALDSTTLCNGVYYIQCPVDTKFVCPKTGEAYCETPSKNKSVSVSVDTLVCNGKEWSKCPQGYNFYCPAQGDAQCMPQSSISTNNQVDTSVSNPNASVSNQTVEKLLQQEIVKQNSFYEEYLQKQAEIDAQLKPVNEEWDRVWAQIETECPLGQFFTGKQAQDCDFLTLKLNSLNSEASRISGIYPERKTLPKTLMLPFQQWRIDTTPGGMSGTIWSSGSTTRYRWSCMNAYSCTLTNY